MRRIGLTLSNKGGWGWTRRTTDRIKTITVVVKGSVGPNFTTSVETKVEEREGDVKQSTVSDISDKDVKETVRRGACGVIKSESNKELT